MSKKIFQIFMTKKEDYIKMAKKEFGSIIYLLLINLHNPLIGCVEWRLKIKKFVWIMKSNSWVALEFLLKNSFYMNFFFLLFHPFPISLSPILIPPTWGQIRSTITKTGQTRSSSLSVWSKMALKSFKNSLKQVILIYFQTIFDYTDLESYLVWPNSTTAHHNQP